MSAARGGVAIANTGLVTSVGLSAPAACAAIRAGLTNPTETRFKDDQGEWMMGHAVPLDATWQGRTKLLKMAAMAAAECLDAVPREQWLNIPLLLCVAERDRPGRLDGLDVELLRELEEELNAKFATESATIPHGRVSVAIALLNARTLLYSGTAKQVLVVATDTFLVWPTLAEYEDERRLLSGITSNGFIPGEGAGAVLLTMPAAGRELLCTGLGFATERAHIRSDEPLRADGLTTAIKEALSDAGCQMHDLDFRITDLSGEQYYFKEASLAVSRTLRRIKYDFDIWHPAECIGESGATAGIAILAVAHAAAHKEYAIGNNMLAHMANDAGQRAAAVLQFRNG